MLPFCTGDRALPHGACFASRGGADRPRIISELAHARTGIDIHPGAEIGPEFAIDHGTGVVIGATCIIGRGVRLYQGVTLGARNFKTAEDGTLLNLPRHPIIEDNVVIYSNASVLGRITVGHDSIIGGNVWVTHAVPPHSRVLQSKVTLGTDFEKGPASKNSDFIDSASCFWALCSVLLFNRWGRSFVLIRFCEMLLTK